ncbi:MAG: flagellar hook basal-body protein [Candidatus Binatia bacterium]
MNRGLWTIASGGVAALARLDAAAQNLANVNTAGYKAVRPQFQLRPLGGGPGGSTDPVLAATTAQVVQTGTAYDFSPGPVRATGNPLDVALTGDEWFVVNTKSGERYTRQGSFTLDAEGYLVTEHGDRVQGDGGDLQVGAGEVTISGNGAIQLDGLEKGRLRLVRFGPQPGLVPEGATLFRAAAGGAQTVEAREVRVVPAALEFANVDAVKGLIELVDVSRGFEAYMNAIRNFDDLTKKSISDVGRF